MFSSDEALVRLAEANVPGLKREIAQLKKRLAAAETERDRLAVERNAIELSVAAKEQRIVELEKELVSRGALLAKVCSLLKTAYGLTVSCDKCGAPEMVPCISDNGRITVHSPRATKAVAEIASESIGAARSR